MEYLGTTFLKNLFFVFDTNNMRNMVMDRQIITYYVIFSFFLYALLMSLKKLCVYINCRILSLN